MEHRNEDYRSIEPFLPLIFESSAVFWPPVVVESLKSISDGPTRSNVNSGGQFALAIADLRNSMEFSSLRRPSASLDFSLFFDDINIQPSSFETEGHEIGIATGNWGCSVFWGDLEVKTIIQWLAASQALRPFMVYYTFGLESLEKLEKIVTWIQCQGWSVGDLWIRLVDYSTQRLNNKTKVGFFRWLLPSLDNDHPTTLNVPRGDSG